MLTKSYYHDTRYPVCPYTLPQIWELAAKEEKGTTLTWADPYERLTHKELYSQAMMIAKGLLALGLKRGDTLCCFGSKGSDPVLMFIACSSLGITFMANYLYAPIEKAMKMVLTQARPAAVMIGDVTAVDYEEPVFSKFIEVTTDEELGHKVSHIMYDRKAEKLDECKPLDGWNSLSHVMELGKTVSDEALQSAKALVGLNEPCFISCSSGSTGEPKLILLGAAVFSNLPRGSKLSQKQLNVSGIPDMAAEDIVMVGHLSTSMQRGSDLIVFPLVTSLEDPNAIMEELVSNVEKYKVELLYYEARCIAEIVNNRKWRTEYDLSALKCITIAGSISTQEFKQKLIEIAPLSVDLFGSTEFFGVTPMNMGMLKRKPTSVGQPSPNVEVKIVDDNGDIVPINTRGQFCVRGPFMFLEYKDQPELTAQATDKDGWLMSGDLVSMDELGYLYVYGRISTAQRWKVEGDVVYSISIESVLRSHPKVRACAVVGTQGVGASGHELNYVIVPVPDSGLQPHDISEFAMEKMGSSIEWPVRVFFYGADQLPKTSGSRPKLNRAKLEEEIIARVEKDPLDSLVAE